jgi:hypothetical protein
MRRVVIASAESGREFLSSGGRRYDTLLVTLTYRPGAEWRAEHVKQYVNATRRHIDRRGLRCRYQWVIELTQAGTPHYHVLWWVPHGERLPMPDKAGSWTHGFSRIERARNAVGYLVKYATKGTTDLYSVPKGARLFGVGGGEASEKLSAHRAGLPMWLLHRIQADSRGRRIAHVGWLDVSTGEVFHTPYSVAWERDAWGIVHFKIIKREIADGVKGVDQNSGLRDEVRHEQARSSVLNS